MVGVSAVVVKVADVPVVVKPEAVVKRIVWLDFSYCHLDNRARLS